MRAVAGSVLRRAGYRLLEAKSPHEALSLVQQGGAPIDLLLTDVIMPKMNGRELAEQVIAKRPTVKVLFMSGYTDDVILHHGVFETAVKLIEKPLTPTILIKRIREVLDAL